MQFFYQTSRFLKKKFNLDGKISIRRVKLPNGYDGDCCFKKDKFLIRIEKSLSEDYAVEVLVHEIAHVLSWEKDLDDHGLNWGKAYSKVYRTFLLAKK